MASIRDRNPALVAEIGRRTALPWTPQSLVSIGYHSFIVPQIVYQLNRRSHHDSIQGHLPGNRDTV